MIFEYRCKNCNKVEDRIVALSECDEQYCNCEDLSKMERQFPDTMNFTLRGRWFNHGGY